LHTNVRAAPRGGDAAARASGARSKAAIGPDTPIPKYSASNRRI
jgi:hypothetical protein